MAACEQFSQEEEEAISGGPASHIPTQVQVLSLELFLEVGMI